MPSWHLHAVFWGHRNPNRKARCCSIPNSERYLLICVSATMTASKTSIHAAKTKVVTFKAYLTVLWGDLLTFSNWPTYFYLTSSTWSLPLMTLLDVAIGHKSAAIVSSKQRQTELLHFLPRICKQESLQETPIICFTFSFHHTFNSTLELVYILNCASFM